MDQLRTECQVLLDISKRKKCDIEELHLRVMESREILNKTYKEFKELQRLHQEYVTQTEESNPQLVLKKAMQEHEGKMKELRDSLAHCDNFSKTLQELYEETQRFYYDEALLKVTPRIQSEAVI
ncbi:uncharacterized protein MONOS_5340 [Monocercomonoides exilis]|uniref:uncharacterized protein n=1 Tax=Monocercomonoides exilis TaxID=2049356 RepID=UPI00355A7BD9|nr:hypothetical protein MONOS_5340 [Monocercomonoides exilis]|eukprot:MONOS_5340.1-p1 / transcript=MONOS_5340.1 / gene=MONOS_5340 / organism=Monocercomonoides_exilis_PA203 / gene_product=unspecified product / transcript_product=unspecified product / location=Mono_scaffold00154:29699-30295(+) / protein_length=124 / sequence_SO=supercontig / SO=protein_coding / is_pseudo=false